MKILAFAVCAFVCVLLTGCTSPQLDIGEYRIAESGRGDFIFAYQDLIFLQIKSPEHAMGSLEYWNWAGKYTIDEGGELHFDMDRETQKRWRFYFSFLKRRNGIVVNDFRTNKGYFFRYQTPQKRENSSPGFYRTGSTGTDPNYAPMPFEE